MIFAVTLLTAQTFNTAIDVDIYKVTTPGERKAMGIEHLTPSQKEAFRQFLGKYALDVANKVMGNAQKDLDGK